MHADSLITLQLDPIRTAYERGYLQALNDVLMGPVSLLTRVKENVKRDDARAAANAARYTSSDHLWGSPYHPDPASRS